MAIRQKIQDLYKKVQPLASSIKDSVAGFAERNELDNPEFYKQLLSRKNLQENAANVFGRQGLASGKGLEAAAKGVYRGAVQPVAELGVNVAVSPQFRDMALNAVRAPGRLNESNLTDTQKNILQGFNIAGAVAPYSAAEKIAVQGLSRALPKVAQSQAGQFAIRRGADVASGQLFMDPNATAQQRLQQAAGDVAFGGVIDAASSATRLAPRFNQELQRASQPRMTQMPDGSMRMTQPVFTAGGNIGEAVSNMRKAEPNVRERSFTKAAKQSPDF